MRLKSRTYTGRGGVPPELIHSAPEGTSTGDEGGEGEEWALSVPLLPGDEDLCVSLRSISGGACLRASSISASSALDEGDRGASPLTALICS